MIAPSIVENARSSRPDRTRARLLESALRLFGTSGLDGVSTRALADAAGVNLNAIQYHYGGKESVYRAVAEHIVATSGRDLREAAENAALDVANCPPRQAAKRAGRLLETIVRIITTAPDAAARGNFILREQLQPTAAFEVLHDGFVGVVHGRLAALVARALDGHGAPADHVVYAHALLGQALVFGMARETLRRRLKKRTLGVDERERIATAVSRLAVAALTELRREVRR